VLVVDPDPGSREQARSLGARQVFAAAEALPAVDGIVVATPATTHASVLPALLARGVPVGCEKPLTTDPASARALCEAAPERLFVLHNWRYHPGIALLAEIARAGELGPVHGLRTFRANWTSPRTDTDSVWTLAPHDLSIAIAVLGEIPEARSALAEVHDGRPVGLVALLGDAPWLVLEVSTRYADKRREVRLHCRDGVAVLPDVDGTHLEIARGGPTDPKPRLERRPFDPEPPLARELRLFVEHLAGGPPLPTSAAEGLAVVTALARLRQLAGV
jgi:predicted dehydrogenase